jgi:crotonobetainyl-CoA:carnitine CoA-transferase CaiB-like acyl-CoA transferase
LYSSHFQAHNRNKRSITLDYTKPQAQGAMNALLGSADVVLLNVRPGVEERLGLAYTQLKARYPGLVYAAITGYGATGPYAERPAYDNVGQSLSGWLSMFHQGTDARVPGPAVSDALTGMYAAMGILGALVERARTGLGRKVEVSMLEATVAFSTEPLGKLFASGQPVPFYSRSASSQSFIVTCKDGHRIGLHLSSPEKFWQGLTLAIGREDLQKKYPDRGARVAGYEALAVDLAQIFATQDVCKTWSMIRKCGTWDCFTKPCTLSLGRSRPHIDPCVMTVTTTAISCHPLHWESTHARCCRKLDWTMHKLNN